MKSVIIVLGIEQLICETCHRSVCGIEQLICEKCHCSVCGIEQLICEKCHHSILPPEINSIQNSFSNFGKWKAFKSSNANENSKIPADSLMNVSTNFIPHKICKFDYRTLKRT